MYLIKNKKSPFYQILFKNDSGKLTTKSTGKKNKSDALLVLSEFQKSRNTKQQNKVITFTAFRDEYLKVVAGSISQKYYKSLMVSFEKFLEYLADDIDLNKIKVKQCEGFINKVFESTKFMAATHYRNLKSVFAKAYKWNHISINPFKQFSLPKIPKKLPVFITADQLKIIVSKTKLPLMKDIFLTAFYTGLRLNELTNLTWQMIDFQNNILTLKHSDTFTTKGKSERVIPINETLLKLLHDRKIKNRSSIQYVFNVGKNIPISGDYISQRFRESVRAAGLNDAFHFHTLRHSFASCLIQSGVSLYVVKELLGHKDFSTTQIYSHIQIKNLSDAVKKLDPVKVENKTSIENRYNKVNFIKYDICLN